jgi:hypothetical protein
MSRAQQQTGFPTPCQPIRRQNQIRLVQVIHFLPGVFRKKVVVTRAYNKAAVQFQKKDDL